MLRPFSTADKAVTAHNHYSRGKWKTYKKCASVLQCTKCSALFIVLFVWFWSSQIPTRQFLHHRTDYSAAAANSRKTTVCFFMFCWPCILVLTTLGKWPTWYTIKLYNTLHVSSNCVLIIRRSNCINTASGIVYYTRCCINSHEVRHPRCILWNN